MPSYFFHSTWIAAYTVQAILNDKDEYDPEHNHVNDHPLYISWRIHVVSFFGFNRWACTVLIIFSVSRDSLENLLVVENGRHDGLQGQCFGHLKDSIAKLLRACVETNRDRQEGHNELNAKLIDDEEHDGADLAFKPVLYDIDEGQYGKGRNYD